MIVSEEGGPKCVTSDFPLMVNGVRVVAAPPEIDIATAEQLRMTLLESATGGHTTVVDMSHTRFCDAAGLNAPVGAHKRAVAVGGELRLVIPADSAVLRAFTLTGLDHFIPHFASLDEAGAHGPAAAIRLPSPRRPPGLRSHAHLLSSHVTGASGGGRYPNL